MNTNNTVKQNNFETSESTSDYLSADTADRVIAEEAEYVDGSTPVREAVRLSLGEAVCSGNRVLFEAPAGSGKSTSAAEIAATRVLNDDLVTIVTRRIAHRKEIKERIEQEFTITVRVRAGIDRCPNINRDKDPAKSLYEAGYPSHVVHSRTCHGTSCPYEDTHNSLAPVEIVSPSHLLHPEDRYSSGRIVIIDEPIYPSVETRVPNVRKHISRLLQQLDDVSCERFDDLREQSSWDPAPQSTASWFADNGLTLQGLDDVSIENKEPIHHDTPALIWGLVNGEEIENGLIRGELPDGRSVVLDTGKEWDQGQAWIRESLNLSPARSVVALDATPRRQEWEVILGDRMKHWRLYSDDKRASFVEENLTVHQLTSAARPMQNPSDDDVKRAAAILTEVRDAEGSKPDVISSSELLTKLERDGHAGLYDMALNFGSLRSSNKLANSDLLVVLGYDSRPHCYYKRFGAFVGESVGDPDGYGPDKSFANNVADEQMRDIRYGGIHQAIMRAARAENTTAKVYVDTAFVPDIFNPIETGCDKPTGNGYDAVQGWRPSELHVMRVMEGENNISAKEIEERMENSPQINNIPSRTRQDALSRLESDGLINSSGRKRGKRYSDAGIASRNEFGRVDLSQRDS